MRQGHLVKYIILSVHSELQYDIKNNANALLFLSNQRVVYVVDFFYVTFIPITRAQNTHD